MVIANIAGNQAHILGKVIKPGQILMTGPTTVLDALSLAGGLDKFADRGGCLLYTSKGWLAAVSC